MEFAQIRHFLAVTETLNFTSAAGACGISQPALSKSIRKLEDVLGADLFVRSPQQVELTEFGRTMRSHLERVEQARLKAHAAARVSASAAVKRLNVGIMCTIGPARFTGFFEAFRQTSNDYEFIFHDVVLGAVPDLLLSGAIDCAISAPRESYDQRFLTLDLFDENMAVAFADNHRFSATAEVPLSEIAEEPYLDRLHCEFRDDFMKLTRDMGLDLSVRFSSEREDWILELIRRGMGVSVIPMHSVSLDAISHRPVGGCPDLRKVVLVMTQNASLNPDLVGFRQAAELFDWRTGGCSTRD